MFYHKSIYLRVVQILLDDGRSTRLNNNYWNYRKNSKAICEHGIQIELMLVKLWMEASEPKCVNSISNNIGVNSLGLGNLHINYIPTCSTELTEAKGWKAVFVICKDYVKRIEAIYNQTYWINDISNGNPLI